MKIQEHRAREIFRQYGIPVPDSEVAVTASDARDVSNRIGYPVVIKAQVLVGGRGKAGGVKIANNSDEAFSKAGEIIGMDIKGLKVEKVLIAKAVDIAKEYYIGITVDRDRKQHVVIVSPAGGINIEEVAEKTPEKIGKMWIDPAYGLHPYELRNVLFGAGFEPDVAVKAAGILMKLYKAVLDLDMSLVEINPLVLTPTGEVLAIDAKINFDDSGIYRHPSLKELKESEDTDPIEIEAHSRGLTYVRLTDGNVGIIGNGAGLVMATMDEVKRAGKGIAKPANFLDIGGGAQASMVKNALEVVLMDPNVKSVLINVFGGITRGDEVAKGLLLAIEGIELKVPVVIRLAGTNWREGKKILEGSRLIPVETLEEACNVITNWMMEKSNV
ncbi:MAG: ADP-forming succinate--CoA ligase subunit beta [bacterium]|nr:ADP-forming succinate--CoA ligase subunit beta [bacterium]